VARSRGWNFQKRNSSFGGKSDRQHIQENPHREG